jgi:hypothetical protein
MRRRPAHRAHLLPIGPARYRIHPQSFLGYLIELVLPLALIFAFVAAVVVVLGLIR